MRPPDVAGLKAALLHNQDGSDHKRKPIGSETQAPLGPCFPEATTGTTMADGCSLTLPVETDSDYSVQRRVHTSVS